MQKLLKLWNKASPPRDYGFVKFGRSWYNFKRPGYPQWILQGRSRDGLDEVELHLPMSQVTTTFIQIQQPSLSQRSP
jgi:hypothetical protein